MDETTAPDDALALQLQAVIDRTQKLLTCLEGSLETDETARLQQLSDMSQLMLQRGQCLSQSEVLLVQRVLSDSDRERYQPWLEEVIALDEALGNKLQSHHATLQKALARLEKQQQAIYAYGAGDEGLTSERPMLT